MRIRLVRTLVLVMVATVVLAVPTAAPAGADPDAAPCTVTGFFTYAPGLTPVPAAQAIGGGLTVTCLVVGDDALVWTLPFAGTGFDNCLSGIGTELWTPAAVGEGPVVAGGFTYVRSSPFAMELYGTITAAAEVHTFVAHVVWAPAGACLPPTVLATVTGAGAISD
ncbi:MAG: hypothetical protein QOF60_1674 [Actinomycetota bacterium]|jgi:hypothetical protein|nr:hypothetical protein [Actinomycetota bacterium]